MVHRQALPVREDFKLMFISVIRCPKKTLIYTATFFANEIVQVISTWIPSQGPIISRRYCGNSTTRHHTAWVWKRLRLKLKCHCCLQHIFRIANVSASAHRDNIHISNSNQVRISAWPIQTFYIRYLCFFIHFSVSTLTALCLTRRVSSIFLHSRAGPLCPHSHQKTHTTTLVLTKTGTKNIEDDHFRRPTMRNSRFTTRSQYSCTIKRWRCTLGDNRHLCWQITQPRPVHTSLINSLRLRALHNLQATALLPVGKLTFI